MTVKTIATAVKDGKNIQAREQMMLAKEHERLERLS